MNHPAGFLTHGKTLTPQEWDLLRENCSSFAPGPGPHGVTFHFFAHTINDLYDRTIVANTLDNSFRCLPQAHCCCQRGALNCECLETRCNPCGQETVAAGTACEDQFCVMEGCGLCNHQREECTEWVGRIREGLASGRDQASREYPEECTAHSYIHAISEVLAPGVGDAPLFPVIRRFLDSELGERMDGAWHCGYGSRIFESSFRGWLEYEERPQTTPTAGGVNA